jgi:hypothetical protein
MTDEEYTIYWKALPLDEVADDDSQDWISIGTSYNEYVPITDGWTGFTNIFRKLLGLPLVNRRACGVRFEPGLIILPGKNRFIVPLSLVNQTNASDQL